MATGTDFVVLKAKTDDMTTKLITSEVTGLEQTYNINHDHNHI